MQLKQPTQLKQPMPLKQPMQPMQLKQPMHIMQLVQLQTCNPHVHDLASNCDQCLPENVNILFYVTASVMLIATSW